MTIFLNQFWSTILSDYVIWNSKNENWIMLYTNMQHISRSSISLACTFIHHWHSYIIYETFLHIIRLKNMFLLLFLKHYNEKHWRTWETAKTKSQNSICCQILPAKSIWVFVLLLLTWQDKPYSNRPQLQKLSHHLSASYKDQSFTATHEIEENDRGLSTVTAAHTAMPIGAPEWFRSLHPCSLRVQAVKSSVPRCFWTTFPLMVYTHILTAVL